MDRRLGIGRPSGPPFTLNVAVDALLKKEFDVHRANGTRHPLVKEYGLYSVPVNHELLPQWRENFVGVQRLHEPTNFLVFGAIDDLWLEPNNQYAVVDYKATSKATEVNIEEGWGPQYKRQMEVYQWLLRGNDLDVSDTGYFVYCNGKKDKEAFDGKLEFSVKIIPYTGSDKWVENTLMEVKKCLVGALPPATSTCEYCTYREAASGVES